MNTIERILELPPFLYNKWFHLKDGLYFIRGNNGIGQVIIVKLAPWEEKEAGEPTGLILWEKVFEISCSCTEWASVLASMSAEGSTIEAYNNALSFHVQKEK